RALELEGRYLALRVGEERGQLGRLRRVLRLGRHREPRATPVAAATGNTGDVPLARVLRAGVALNDAGHPGRAEGRSEGAVLEAGVPLRRPGADLRGDVRVNHLQR